jgi:type VI protein secretion system component VasK
MGARRKADGGGAAQSEVSPMEEWVTRARGIGLVAGFLIAFLVCRGQGFPMADAMLRGLVGAALLSVVAWWSALMVIQALMRAAAAQARAEGEAAAAQMAAAREEADAVLSRRGAAPDEAAS